MPVYTYTTLDDPLATFGSHPRSINATGQIVGDYNNGGNHGFLLTGGTYTTFDDPSHPGIRHQRRGPDRGDLCGCHRHNPRLPPQG